MAFDEEHTQPRIVAARDVDLPDVTGRSPEDNAEYHLSNTRRGRRAEIKSWVGGGCEVVAEIFHSTYGEDCGGWVLRIRLVGALGDAMLPTAKLIPGGVELHVGGEEEGRRVAQVVRAVLAEEGVST